VKDAYIYQSSEFIFLRGTRDEEVFKTTDYIKRFETLKAASLFYDEDVKIFDRP
jgi:hypothetical protein